MYTSDSKIHTFTYNSSGSALFAKTKLILRETNTISLEIITGDPSIYTMDQPKFIVLNQKEESINA